MKVDEFDLPVEIFNQSGATFNPIPAVEVFYPFYRLGLRAVDVAADDAVGFVAARHGGERVLVFRDVFYGGFGLEFQIRRERPVTETERAAQPVEIQIEIENPVIEVRAELFQQVIEMRQAVRLVAVDDEVFFSVGGRMDHLPGDGHGAEFHAHELLNEFVVVAGNVNHLGLLAAFAEQFLDERVVVLAPEPAELQLPAVDEIADEVEVFAVHHTQKVQQFINAGVPGAEMDVGNPDGAADNRLVEIQIEILLISFHNPTLGQLCWNLPESQSLCGVVAEYSPGRNAGVTIPLSEFAGGQPISWPPPSSLPGWKRGRLLWPAFAPPDASGGSDFGCLPRTSAVTFL